MLMTVILDLLAHLIGGKRSEMIKLGTRGLLLASTCHTSLTCAHTSHSHLHRQFYKRNGVGKLTLELRVLAALAEDQSLIPSIHSHL